MFLQGFEPVAGPLQGGHESVFDIASGQQVCVRTTIQEKKEKVVMGLPVDQQVDNYS